VVWDWIGKCRKENRQPISIFSSIRTDMERIRNVWGILHGILQHQSMFETVFFMAELISVQPELQEKIWYYRSQIERL
jgi:hypothetical protein